MKLKMYFLAAGADVLAGPFFSVEMAVLGKQKLHPMFKSLAKIVKLDGQFELVEVE